MYDYNLRFTKASELIACFFEEGVFAMAIGYPTVPQGKARIRVMNSAAHSASDIEQALEMFGAVGKELGVIE